MPDFVAVILSWYEKNKRDLPWRNTKNPYFIWLSEIILQQTRVEQGLPYYEKFVSEFPSVADLALADEQKVLKLWQGLGYYSRARNLHQTAKFIHFELNDQFPSTYKKLLQLKGIGNYTAAAIASFAFNEKKAAVDGNVYRVLSRIFDIDLPIDSTEGKKFFEKLANELIPNNFPGMFNQAMMEFGATQCVPVNPSCEICPVRHACEAYKNKTIALRPEKAKKTKVRPRYLHYFVFHDKNSIVLKKRTQNDIWKNLFDFPLIDKEKENDITLILKEAKIKRTEVTRIVSTKHQLSHQLLHITFYEINKIPAQQQLLTGDCQIVPMEKLNQFPLPKVIAKFLEKK